MTGLVLWAGVPAFSQETYDKISSRRDVLPEYIQEFLLSDTVRAQEKGEIQVSEFSFGSATEHIGDNTSELNNVNVGMGYEVIRLSALLLASQLEFLWDIKANSNCALP